MQRGAHGLSLPQPLAAPGRSGARAASLCFLLTHSPALAGLPRGLRAPCNSCKSPGACLQGTRRCEAFPCTEFLTSGRCPICSFSIHVKRMNEVVLNRDHWTFHSITRAGNAHINRSRSLAEGGQTLGHLVLPARTWARTALAQRLGLPLPSGGRALPPSLWWDSPGERGSGLQPSSAPRGSAGVVPSLLLLINTSDTD